MPVPGSGLGAQWGVKPETVFGTWSAVDQFLEILSVKGPGLKLIRKQGGGIAAGRMAPLASQLVTVGREAELSLDVQVPTVKFGRYLQQLFGTTVTPVQQGATPAYLQTHAYADTFGKSLSGQLGVPQTNGTVSPFSYLGGKITKAEFKCKTDDFLTASLDFDFRDLTEAQALAAATYATTAAPFGFSQLAVKAGATVGAAAAIAGVKGFGLSINRKMDTGRRYANGNGLKDEPILNDWDDIASGSIDADYVTKADLYDRFAGDTAFALVFQFTGAIISGAFNYQLTFELPAVKLTGNTPNVDGPGIVSGPFPFQVLSNNVDPIVTCKYMSTDVTL